MACTCADTIEEKMKDRNTRLLRGLSFDPTAPEPMLFITSEQVETGRGKKKATNIIATFCPFCGVKYRAEKTPD